MKMTKRRTRTDSRVDKTSPNEKAKEVLRHMPELANMKPRSVWNLDMVVTSDLKPKADVRGTAEKGWY